MLIIVKLDLSTADWRNANGVFDLFLCTLCRLEIILLGWCAHYVQWYSPSSIEIMNLIASQGVSENPVWIEIMCSDISNPWPISQFIVGLWPADAPKIWSNFRQPVFHLLTGADAAVLLVCSIRTNKGLSS